MRAFTGCAGHYGNIVVMIHFMRQHDLTMRYLNICSSIILGLSVSLFWMRLAFE